MTINHRMDEELVENISLAAQVSSCVVLAGVRQYDRFLLSKQDDAPRVLSLERLCHESIGAQITWGYDPARRRVVVACSNGEIKPQTTLPVEAGGEKDLDPFKAIEAFSMLKTTGSEARFAMLVDAGLLFADSRGPHGEDFRLLQAIEHFARNGDRSRVLILRVGRSTDLPGAIPNAPQVKTVQIPPASRDVRHAYAAMRGAQLVKHCEVSQDAVARTLSDATEDWTLEQLDALMRTAERDNLASLHDLEELARALRIGNTHSPWAGDRIRLAVSQAGDELTRRVMGQPKAVEAVVSALRKAVIGLSAAHQSRGSQAPRAIFFFAGPTGTGKTELAKAISQLVFGQEQLLRFDCGELRQEHAVARLIGAPPGYVGYDRGGELTEGIRAKPNSVVLFDEIEKAHPRLLDTLLGVLDDGRLTSGQGETSYFGQAVLVFTSNLGMYEEHGDGNRIVERRPRFGYDTPFDVIEKTVREAIREEFVTVLGRPELLGRFGGADSIIVFDYLRNLDLVCRKFVANIAICCRRLHGIELVVEDDVISQMVTATRERPDLLVLGGRGLRPELDRRLTDPLAAYLFENPQTRGGLRASRNEDHTVFAECESGET